MQSIRTRELLYHYWKQYLYPLYVSIDSCDLADNLRAHARYPRHSHVQPLPVAAHCTALHGSSFTLYRPIFLDPSIISGKHNHAQPATQILLTTYPILRATFPRRHARGTQALIPTLTASSNISAGACTAKNANMYQRIRDAGMAAYSGSGGTRPVCMTPETANAAVVQSTSDAPGWRSGSIPSMRRRRSPVPPAEKRTLWCHVRDQKPRRPERKTWVAGRYGGGEA